MIHMFLLCSEILLGVQISHNWDLLTVKDKFLNEKKAQQILDLEGEYCLYRAIAVTAWKPQVVIMTKMLNIKWTLQSQ